MFLFKFKEPTLQQKIEHMILTNLIILKGKDDYYISAIIARNIIYLLKKEKAIK